MKRQREITKVGFTMGSHGSYAAALLLLCFCSLQTGGRASVSDSFASQQQRNDGRLLRQRRMAYHTYTQGQETTDGNIFGRSSLTKEEFITQNRHSPNEKQLQVKKETYKAKGDENAEISSRTDLVQTGLTKTEFIQQRRNSLRQKPATYSAKVLVDKPVAGELPTAKENESLVRVVVEYRDMFGKEIALQHAYALYHDLVDEKSIVIEVTEIMAEKLKKNRLIVNVQEDSIWKEQGYLERIVEREELENGSYWKSAPGRSANKLRERQLEEIIPYGISMIQADQLSVGPHPVTVCAVDTGLAISHPDIDENRADGIDRESNVNNKWLQWNNDTRGHGTHIVGTLAAKINNDLGVRGVGNLNVFVTRGLNNMGSAYESDIREAMEQCENAGAKIINLSLGGGKMSDSMKVIIDRLFSKGFLIFAAAGNEGKWRMEYPASDPHVVSVGALDSTGWFWANSNFGPTLEIMAPGHKILSTTVNSTTGEPRYAEYSGTSMAAPHASGAAALLWSHFPNCTNQQIRYSIMYTATDKGYPKCDQDFGFGVLQVKDAFDFLAAHPCEEANWGQKVGSGNCSTIDTEPTGGNSSASNSTLSASNSTVAPSVADTPSYVPSDSPLASDAPSSVPSEGSGADTLSDTFSNIPSVQPSAAPSIPTLPPTGAQTSEPTDSPSLLRPVAAQTTGTPTETPSLLLHSPTMEPTLIPSSTPTMVPTLRIEDANDPDDSTASDDDPDFIVPKLSDHHQPKPFGSGETMNWFSSRVKKDVSRWHKWKRKQLRYMEQNQ